MGGKNEEEGEGRVRNRARGIREREHEGKMAKQENGRVGVGSWLCLRSTNLFLYILYILFSRNEAWCLKNM